MSCFGYLYALSTATDYNLDCGDCLLYMLLALQFSFAFPCSALGIHISFSVFSCFLSRLLRNLLFVTWNKGQQSYCPQRFNWSFSRSSKCWFSQSCKDGFLFFKGLQNNLAQNSCWDVVFVRSSVYQLSTSNYCDWGREVFSESKTYSDYLCQMKRPVMTAEK